MFNNFDCLFTLTPQLNENIAKRQNILQKYGCNQEYYTSEPLKSIRLSCKDKKFEYKFFLKINNFVKKFPMKNTREQAKKQQHVVLLIWRIN